MLSKKGTSATKKNLKRRKKIVPPSKMVTLRFYHPDHRINFFMVDFLLKPLIKSKKLRQYVYTSSGNDWQGIYNNNHTLDVYEDQVGAAIAVLKEDGWVFTDPYYNNYG
jgi:hypothetical protein